MIVRNGPRRWPVVSVVNGINTTHRSLASLFFDDVGDEPGCARNHEYAIKGCRTHSQVGENGADRAVYINGKRLLRVSERFLDFARRLHVHARPLRLRARSNGRAVRGSLAWRR